MANIDDGNGAISAASAPVGMRDINTKLDLLLMSMRSMEEGMSSRMRSIEEGMSSRMRSIEEGMSSRMRSIEDQILHIEQSLQDHIARVDSSGAEELVQSAVASTGHLVSRSSGLSPEMQIWMLERSYDDWSIGSADDSRASPTSSLSTSDDAHSAVSSTGHMGDMQSTGSAVSHTSSTATMTVTSDEAHSDGDGAGQALAGSSSLSIAWTAWTGLSELLRRITSPGLRKLTELNIEEWGSYRIVEWVISDWSSAVKDKSRYGGEFYSWKDGYRVGIMVWPNSRKSTRTMDRSCMKIRLRVIPTGYQYKPGYQLSCQLSLFLANGTHIYRDVSVTWASVTESKTVDFELDHVTPVTGTLHLKCRIDRTN